MNWCAYHSTYMQVTILGLPTHIVIWVKDGDRVILLQKYIDRCVYYCIVYIYQFTELKMYTLYIFILMCLHISIEQIGRLLCMMSSCCNTYYSSSHSQLAKQFCYQSIIPRLAQCQPSIPMPYLKENNVKKVQFSFR